MSDPPVEILGCASRKHPMLALYATSIRAWSNGEAVTAEEKADFIANLRRLMRLEWGEIDVV